MAEQLRVSVQEIVPEFVQLAKRGKGNLVLSNTMAAVEKLSTMYQETWVQAASGASFPGLPFVINSTQYQRTIQRRQISPTMWEIFSNYSTKTGRSVTELLESGHGNIDLKPGLLRGPKSRQGAEGRYNIVAFRHGTPGSDPFRNSPMPLSVYKSFTQEIKKVDAQRKAGASPISGTSYTSKSGTKPGDRSYDWGTKYDVKNQRGRRSKLIQQKGKRIGEYTWKTGKYAGMVRLQQSTTRAQRGGYLTFRVVSAASDPLSWIVPEQEPWPIRKVVTDFMRPFAESILKEAMEADIK
ncbi:MAG: hypothetical protein ACXADB_00470 [Candidatus Hermodarchaeia archaeon]|jgi:hypothetical protein